MYARYFTFKSTPDKRKAVEALADAVSTYAKSLNGFVNITFFISDDESEYGSFSIWETKDDAEKAGASLREKVATTLERIVTAPPEVVVLEVYEPGS